MSYAEQKEKTKLAGQEQGSLPAGSPAATESSDDKEYEAHKSVAHDVFNLHVRTNAANKKASVVMPYSLMNHMVVDDYGFVISMHFSNCPIICITLQGRDMKEIMDGLIEHKVRSVQEFDARKWKTPPQGKPCITGIEITHRELPENSELAGDKKPDGNPVSSFRH